MSATVGEDWASPVADVLAAPWDISPGRSFFWRSSATHVFVTRDEAFPRGARFLRAVPARCSDLTRVAGTARLVTELGRQGAGVAVPVPSKRGRLVESVRTRLGEYHVTLVEGAPGKEIGAEVLTPAQGAVWGTALAQLHLRTATISGLPSAVPDLRRVQSACPGDPELVTAVLDVADRLDALPREPARFGLTHNDFELDNLAWEGEAVTAFDFDEAGRSWFAADVAKAVDELTGRAGTPLFDAFVRGYRSIRPLDDDELAMLPLFDLARAADGLILLRDVLDLEARAGDPDWLVKLRASLEARYARQRAALLGFTARGA